MVQDRVQKQLQVQEAKTFLVLRAIKRAIQSLRTSDDNLDSTVQAELEKSHVKYRRSGDSDTFICFENLAVIVNELERTTAQPEHEWRDTFSELNVKAGVVVNKNEQQTEIKYITA